MPHLLKRALRVSATLAVVAVCGLLVAALWRAYVLSPWTRDGRVSADVVQIMPEVSGTVVEVAIADNQPVRRGQVLYRLDPDRFQIALDSAQAELAGRQAEVAVKASAASRRNALGEEIIATEVIDQANGETRIARAAVESARANVALAKLNLQRATVRAPVDGYVTNLRLRPGDYASAGLTKVSVVDSRSYWVTGYFEETKLARIAPGARAQIRLMGYETPLEGQVVSIGHGIANANESPDARGLPTVNPVFTWIRLAQRIPVRVRIDRAPPGVTLAAGMTCSVSVGEAAAEGRLLSTLRRLL